MSQDVLCNRFPPKRYHISKRVLGRYLETPRGTTKETLRQVVDLPGLHCPDTGYMSGVRFGTVTGLF